jgi:uncharacterized protein
MSDPFEALRTAPTPIDPDPAFAARLRARVIRALHPDQGEQTMTLRTPETETVDRLRQGDMSYVSLWVPDVERAARFFGTVLGWTYGSSTPGAPFREVQNQSISLGITELGASGEYLRQLGVPLEAELSATGYVVFVVDDLGAASERVRIAGGWAGAPMDQAYGRVVACADDQGMPFSLHEVPPQMRAARPPAGGNRQGDIAYLVFEVPDDARARAFFGSVLGLQFSPGRTENGWNIADVVPMSGLSGGQPRSAIVPMYRVDDIQAAVQRVRAAGGTATEPVIERYGARAECTDDQGLRFLLGGF